MFYVNVHKWKRLIRRHRIHLVILTAVLMSAVYCTNCMVRKEPDKVWDLRGKVVQLAQSLQGLPYQYGGYDIEGFDCSGLVYYVYEAFGLKVPRTARKQAKMKGSVRLKQARPSDILAFKLKRRWHTAIYIGDNFFIHAPNAESYIRKERLNAFWKKRLKAVISVIKE